MASCGCSALAHAGRDLPERYGPYTTCYKRFNRWRKKGIWDRLRDAIVEAYDGNIQIIDSSSIRVHQHTAGADRFMGRSRGGLTTKIHAVVDASDLPLRFALIDAFLPVTSARPKRTTCVPPMLKVVPNPGLFRPPFTLRLVAN